MRKLIIWSVGTNGDGSSQLVSNLIKSFDRNQLKYKILIFLSKDSLLENKIMDFKFKKIKIIKLPDFFRNNLFHLFIKTFFTKLIHEMLTKRMLGSKKQKKTFRKTNVLKQKHKKS